MSFMHLFNNWTTKPVTCTWIIDKFFESTPNRQKMFSPETKLYFGSFNLNLILSRDNVIITCSARDNIPEFYYRISLIDKDDQKWKTKEGRTGSDFRYDIRLRSLRAAQNGGLFTDGKLTIYCEIFEFKYVRRIPNPLENLVSPTHDKNQSLLDFSVNLCDVVLIVDGREFKAHKSILSSRSVIFEKMFNESKRNRVQIEDMSAGACLNLLKFIYTGKMLFLDNGHVYELYAAADKYQIESLKSHCELYLTVSLSVSTLPKTLQLADQYSLEDLKSKCIDYIRRHSTQFKFDDWKQLTTRKPGLMYQVFDDGSKQTQQMKQKCI